MADDSEQSTPEVPVESTPAVTENTVTPEQDNLGVDETSTNQPETPEGAGSENVSPMQTQPNKTDTNTENKLLKEEIKKLKEEINKLKEEEKQRKNKEKNKPAPASTEKDALLALWEDLNNAVERLRKMIWEGEKALLRAAFTAVGSSIVKLGGAIKDSIEEKKRNQEELETFESGLTDKEIEQIPRQSLEDFLAEPPVVETQNPDELDNSEWHEVGSEDLEGAKELETQDDFVIVEHSEGTPEGDIELVDAEVQGIPNELPPEEPQNLDDFVIVQHSDGLPERDIELNDIESNTNSDVNLEGQQEQLDTQSSQTQPSGLRPQPGENSTDTSEKIVAETPNVLPVHENITSKNLSEGLEVDLQEEITPVKPG